MAPESRAVTRNLRRDKVAAALCTWILRHVATGGFRRAVTGAIRYEMLIATRRPAGYYLEAARHDELAATGLARIKEIVANATDEDHARVARMRAHVEAQLAQLPPTHR